MQVQFKNALFDSADFAFAVVVDSTLMIVTSKAEIELDFDSQDEALAAQAELGQLIDSAKTPDLSDLVAGAASVVTDLFGGLFSKGKSSFKATKTAATTAQSDVASVVEEMLSALEAAMNPAGSTGADARPAARSTAAEANDVFGTNRTSRTDAADTVIADLTDAVLRTTINEKADHLIATDARVQEMVEQLHRFYSDEQVDQVIATRKQQVFNMAKANPSLTVNQLFAEILRG